MKAIQFDEGDLSDLKDIGVDDEHRWSFTKAMVSTCAPLFDNCECNYDVADKLKKAKVIGKSDMEDSESSQFFIYFKTKQQGMRFINRLNKYLVEKAELLSMVLVNGNWEGSGFLEG